MSSMSQIRHILNGDCLYEQLMMTPMQQNHIIFRECLIDGPVNGETLNEFWQNRAAFMARDYNVLPSEYYKKTVDEFEKIIQIPDGDEICLWFEHDLFCQINMWFIISVLTKRKGLNVFRVSPICHHEMEFWKGFGASTPEMLMQAYQQKILFQDHDLQLGIDLWEAYKKNDVLMLKKLSLHTSECFSMLEDICQAQIDRLGKDGHGGKPEVLVRQLLKEGHKSFDDLMSAFNNIGGVYGFGDFQLKKIYDNEKSIL